MTIDSAPAEWDAIFDDDDDSEGADFIAASGEGKPQHSEIDISSKDFWNQTSEQRDERFRKLRETDPVSWQRPVEDAVTPDPDDPGYWALVKHEHILEVSRDNDTYISGQGVLFDLLPEIFLQMSLAMDNPRHDKLRKLVSVAFTPKQIRRIEDQIKLAAKEVVDSFASDPSGEIDFPERCGERLPERLFCEMFGIPGHLRAKTVKAAGDVVAWADPEYLAGRPADELQVEACATLHEIAEELLTERRENPTEDLFSALMNAEVDGEKLDDFDIGAFFVLMSVAGTDTTKHTSAFTVLAMTQFPEQREWLMEDYDGRIDTAIEEFVRYASPVMTFRRTAVVETELGGKKIQPGDKVSCSTVGQPRHRRLHRPGALRPLAQAEPARRLRRRRHALLPRQPARQGCAARAVP